jgi:hypothetical protein
MVIAIFRCQVGSDACLCEWVCGWRYGVSHRCVEEVGWMAALVQGTCEALATQPVAFHHQHLTPALCLHRKESSQPKGNDIVQAFLGECWEHMEALKLMKHRNQNLH